ncbi:TPA: hypothetical protein L0W95_001630 [Enterococcus faecium]|uniref:hypothetical protein n=1 Tax=Enterococcus faecium TaxID=1352 RepID=UPI001A1A505B|nr:hypothetical protein [Enterococcus faecium]MBK0899425.1 hypothetical protein [Enterococcus faecium]MCU1822414.1 hypothetical protein [Enterococcus faecium]MDT2340317.1 hypothetical protein [Enterococcus faecium]MDW7937292.1 hypothetical protein [Enterococcus faecium]GMR73145.1 hypothetical protein NUITMVRE10_18370 [Enterococcus faecium]
MNDFHEAVLSIEVESSLAKVYKKAIEAENSPYRENWNGNHAHVQVENDDYRTGMNTLVISLLSHTLPNLQETIEWYERMGAKVISTNYKGENQNGNDQN